MRVAGKYEAEWGLEQESSRPRFTTSKENLSERIHVRLSQSQIRMLDEIIQSQLDDRIKTYSDAVRDGVSIFLDDWAENYSDGLSGRALRLYQMEKEDQAREERKAFIDKMDRDITKGKELRDVDGLQRALHRLRDEFTEFKDHAPIRYVQELSERIGALEGLLSKEIEW